MSAITTSPGSPIRTARLVYIAPEAGSSGVGDYASDFAAAIRPHVGELVQVRHPGPGGETLGSVLRQRRELRRLLRRGDRPTIVHAEQSGGALLPFWGPLGLRARVSSATVHDPPLGVWFPLRTRLLARHRLLGHAVNLPLSLLAGPLERRVDAGRHLFALSRLGGERLAGTMRRSTISTTWLFVPQRPALPPVPERPLAVGLFGYVYRGKGFDALAALRRALDPAIAIRVAGRGTDRLPALDGVEVLGAVDGAAEDAFFASIRMLLVPYTPRVVYGRVATPAASTVSRAVAYRTPVLALRHGALAELEEDGGAIVVDGGPAELASAAAAALADGRRLRELEAQSAALARRRSAAEIAADFVRAWEDRW
jgi:polysaccharide biosynthesis protein PslF